MSLTTETDRLPETWQTKLLGECATVQTGIAKGRRVDPDEAIPVPYLRVANVQDGYLDLSEIKTIELRRGEIDRYRLQPGDVVLTEGGDLDKLGRGYVWSGEIPECVHQNHVFAVRVNRSELDPNFFSYQAQSPYGKSYFLSVAHKTTNLACINTTKLKAFPVLIPPLPEQKAIAHTLATVQQAIAAQEQIIQTTTELKKALMQKLFSEGLRGEPQKETEIGLVPESWEVCTIGDVAMIQSGGTPSREAPENWNGGTIPWVKTGEINYCTITDTEEKITPLGLANSSARLFPMGTLLMAMYGQGITRGRVGLLGIEAASNQACAAIIPLDPAKTLTQFLYYFFEYSYERLRQLGHGANQKNMSATLIRSFMLMLPTPNEREEIAAVLSALDQKLARHHKKLVSNRWLFRTLMHELMTAKARVDHTILAL